MYTYGLCREAIFTKTELESHMVDEHEESGAANRELILEFD